MKHESVADTIIKQRILFAILKKIAHHTAFVFYKRRNALGRANRTAVILNNLFSHTSRSSGDASKV